MPGVVGHLYGVAVSRIDDVLSEVASFGADDIAWKNGRAFSLAYYAGPDVQRVADEAFAMYGSANGLNVDAFPSLRRFQSDVVSTVSGWLSAPDGAAGFMTSGGTESILLAVKAAREHGRRERGVSSPNVVMPTSAHAAFEKGCYYFGVEARRAAVRDDWRADVSAMESLIDENTVMLVGSAPQYPQGVIDPIPAIASLAASRDLLCHVDACMGGVTLHFLETAGETIAPWNFSVPGVTSMSVDLHKYGYTSKGASVVVYRTKSLRALQTFVTDNWLGGLYGSSGILGTKSGGPMAAAWAVLRYLGDDGYRDLTMRARRAALRLADAVDAHPDLILRARPDSTLLSFGSDRVDPFAIADRLATEGWYVDRQSPPPSLHCTVNAVHDQVVDEFVAALGSATAEATSASEAGSAGAYGTVD
ncbi:MAG: aspartate aminotransferase family protein [Acidimicrobiales bacterium mtb01]|nr:aspartate aminotransferase family protein [Actinomycetota bacterium]TEX45167.1 MAG: aspartate aminotransferase family protein [Acidimicrobiales bacterium mtb01]